MAAMPVRKVDAPRPRSSGARRAADGRATPSSTSRPGKRPESRPELRLVPRPRAAANAAMLLFGVVEDEVRALEAAALRGTPFH